VEQKRRDKKRREDEQKRREDEKKRREELEKKRREELEQKRIAELEQKRREEDEKKRIAELEQQMKREKKEAEKEATRLEQEKIRLEQEAIQKALKVEKKAAKRAAKAEARAEANARAEAVRAEAEAEAARALNSIKLNTIVNMNSIDLQTAKDHVDHMFPLINQCFDKGTEEYKYAVSLTLYLVGLLNQYFKENNIKLKMIIKGGRAAHMILSKFNVETCDIKSDDVDVFIVQTGQYNRQVGFNISRQFAELFSRILSNIDIEFPKLGYDTVFKVYQGSNPVVDIDFGPVDNTLFDYYEIEPNYYVQTPEAFLNEKRFYLNKYNMDEQIAPDGTKCDCKLKFDEKHICNYTCKYRTQMQDKFRRYIEPFEKLSNTLENR
jgi:hypothetical protein